MSHAIPEAPPTILLIHRDGLRPGSEATYRAVEEDAARICADLNCPHPHFAIESVTGPKEVWWLNAFDSEAEKRRVIDAYKSNRRSSAHVITTPEDLILLDTGTKEMLPGLRANIEKLGHKLSDVKIILSSHAH